MSYASAAEVAAELEAYPDLPAVSAEVIAALIPAAERAVDARLGPYAVDPVSGLKLDPAELNAAQVAGLVRAVTVAVAHLSQLDAEQRLGLDDFAPEQLRPMAGRGLGHALDEALAGLDLIGRSLTVVTPPDDDLSA